MEPDTAETPELVPVDLAIQNLARAGLPPELIASSLGKSPQYVRTIISIRRAAPLSVEMKHLAEEVRGLAEEAVRKARIRLRFGTQAEQLTIIKAILPAAARFIDTDTGSSDEQRAILETIFNEMRGGVNPIETLVTETDFVDVEAEAVTQTANDSDQGTRAT